MKEFDYDIITRYLDGTLNAGELKAFEEQMQQDAELKNEVILLKEVNTTLRSKLHPGETETALRNSLRGLNSEYFSGKPQLAKVVPFGQRKWITAIAAVFIMGLILTIWQPWKKEDLFKQYAALEMPGVSERGAAADSLLKLAVEDFNNKEFAAAIPLLEQVLTDSNQNSFVQYYYAIALLQNDQLNKSRIQLSELYNGVSIFKYDAAFYMALSYLKEKDKDSCKEWLHKIPADTGPYGKAQELLKKL